MRRGQLVDHRAPFGPIPAARPPRRPGRGPRRAVSRTLILTLLALGAVHSAVEGVPQTIVFGSDVHYPPFEWRDGGELTGFNIDIAKSLAAVGNRDFDHRSGPWSRIVAALEAGTIDVVPMFRTPQREQQFRFSEPFYVASMAAFARAETPAIARPPDLSGKTVAAVAKSRVAEQLEQAAAASLVHLADNPLAALRAVEQRRVQYALVDRAVANTLIRRHGLGLRQKGPPLWSQAYAFAVMPERTALADWLDGAFDSLIASGRFEAILARWDGELEAGPLAWRDRLWPAAAIALPLLALAALALTWGRMLRTRVASRTAALSGELEQVRVAEARARQQARRDAATGLPRRPRLVEDIDAALARKRGGARAEVLALRVGNLDDLTRAFGHQSGEDARSAFAERLRATDADAVGLLGEDRFGALAIGRDIDALIGQLAQPLAVGPVDFEPVVLAGVARGRNAELGGRELLRRAETALTRVRGLRSTHALYDPSMEPDPDDLELIGDFRRTRGEALEALFQPQIRLADGACVGCEALARWEHPRLGAIPPSRLVPLLESAGLIGTLTACMVERSLALAQQLRDAHLACPVSVNISALDLLAPESIESVEHVLARHGAMPDEIKVEITATSFAQNPDAVRQGLEQLRAVGVRSSIDDFGVGYAALTDLGRFAADELKIDRLYIRDMTRNTRHRAIVRATISLAKDLGLAAVAEGADDQATLDALRADGCDRVQGNVVAEPLRAGELLKFVQAHGSARHSPTLGRD